MTDELMEKIAYEIAYWEHLDQNERWKDVRSRWLVRADRILILIEEAGYVKLSEDQTPPCNCPAPSIINLNTYPEGQRFGYYQAMTDMLKAGWRRVETKGGEK